MGESQGIRADRGRPGPCLHLFPGRDGESQVGRALSRVTGEEPFPMGLRSPRVAGVRRGSPRPYPPGRHGRRRGGAPTDPPGATNRGSTPAPGVATHGPGGRARERPRPRAEPSRRERRADAETTVTSTSDAASLGPNPPLRGEVPTPSPCPPPVEGRRPVSRGRPAKGGNQNSPQVKCLPC